MPISQPLLLEQTENDSRENIDVNFSFLVVAAAESASVAAGADTGIPLIVLKGQAARRWISCCRRGP